jgi:ribosomal protein S18 acetylase RimI-like enzyme
MDIEGNNRRLKERYDNDSIHITLALDGEKLIGYCISIASDFLGEKRGEIYSIYVEPEYRGGIIGDNLMERALKWINGRGARRIVLAVGAGNEAVFAFYARFNFYPRITVLQQVKNGDNR